MNGREPASRFWRISAGGIFFQGGAAAGAATLCTRTAKSQRLHNITRHFSDLEG